MPATTLTAIAGPSKWSTVGKIAVMSAADAVNGNDVLATNDMLVVAQNTGGSAYTVTITSKPLAGFDRQGDVSAVSLAAGEIRLFRLTKNGWMDSTSKKIAFSANNSAVKFSVVDLTQSSTST